METQTAAHTPRTDSLFARHVSESRNISDKGLLTKAVKQVKELLDLARTLEQENARLTALLRAWVAGCGDELYSSKEQVKKLLKTSGNLLAELERTP